MNPAVIIEVPGIPVSKLRARSFPLMNRKTGKPVLNERGAPRIVNVTPEKTRNYEAYAKYCAATAMRGVALFETALEVDVMVLLPVPASWSKRKRADALRGAIRPTTRPDADNIVKTLDAFNGVVWRDDSQIADLHVRRRYALSALMRVTVTADPPTHTLEQLLLFMRPDAALGGPHLTPVGPPPDLDLPPRLE